MSVLERNGWNVGGKKEMGPADKISRSSFSLSGFHSNMTKFQIDNRGLVHGTSVQPVFIPFSQFVPQLELYFQLQAEPLE